MRRGLTQKIEGPIGDRLVIRVRISFPEESPFDFRSHTWLAQLRHNADSPVALTLTLEDDSTTETEIDLTFVAEDTSTLDERPYQVGVKAITGTHAPWTAVPGLTVKGYRVIAQEEPGP